MADIATRRHAVRRQLGKVATGVARRVITATRKRLSANRVTAKAPTREAMLAKRDEFERTGKTTLHEAGQQATISRDGDKIKVAYVDRRGKRSTMTFTDGDEAGRWFAAHFPQHARV